MGKIYNDIDNNDEVAEILNNMYDTCNQIEGRDDIKFRDTEIRRIYNIMDKFEYRSVMLVGDHGIGKRSIIEGYVNELYKNKRNDAVIEINFNEICRKSSSVDFGKLTNDIFYVASNNKNFDIVLVLHNIGHLLNINCYGNAGFNFLNNIIEKIENENIRIIVTATNNEYKTIEDAFSKFIDYFTVIKLTELTKEQSSEIIKDKINLFEDTFKLHLPDNFNELIATNADKYIKGFPFPGKAYRLSDEVCSSIVNKYRPVNAELFELTNQSLQLREDLHNNMEAGNFSACETLNNQLDEILNKIEEVSSNSNYEVIEVVDTDVLEAIGTIVDVKMSKLSKNQIQFLKDMPNELKSKVIGQDEAIDVLVKNIRRNQLGLRKTAHSAGNFMFIGSTGVGKTYLAKQLAKYLYGSEENLLRLDMSEYQSEIDVSKLLGSAPGYVGFKETGVLVRGLAKKPETVVLFDEIEKAHPKIYDVLLQLLDEGFITGSDGKKVDATKSLIIFTSNIGVKKAMEQANPLGFSQNFDEKKNERKEQIIRKALKSRFSPEFLNRLDNVCYFNSLSKDILRSILYKELAETNEGIIGVTGKKVELSPEVEEWILDKVEKEDNGARPVIRILQQNIEETISDMIINEDEAIKTDNSDNSVLVAYLENDKVVLR